MQQSFSQSKSTTTFLNSHIFLNEEMDLKKFLRNRSSNLGAKNGGKIRHSYSLEGSEEAVGL